jgi:TolA-binding protein
MRMAISRFLCATVYAITSYKPVAASCVARSPKTDERLAIMRSVASESLICLSSVNMQENLVEQSENRRVRADTKRERENAHGRETGILAKASGGVAKVLAKGLDGVRSHFPNS